jgi:hypothetical protein
MNRDNSFENRPLPTPPRGCPEKDSAMFGDRYSYFKNEIQKWRSDLKPNPMSNNASNPNGQNGPGPINARKFVMGNNENASPNVLREIDSNRESHREKNFLGNLDSNLKPTNANAGPTNGARAQIVIPKNLNIKEEQLPFFSDLQNVLTLFSELKSRIEKISTEKSALVKTTEALSSNYESLQREFANQD